VSTTLQPAKAASVAKPVDTGDREFVKALGPLSSTTIVVGSMIGSGIFIVSADIARLTNSPGLLIGAWLLTGFLTIAAALSYGELAAMMPRAGGQYVYLRESLGPLWGFLYGWTLFLVIQTGTIAAVGVAFGKFLGVFFPSVSANNWIWHIAHVPAWNVGPMTLGNMDVGLNTANLAAIIIIVVLTGINIYGVKTGALVQNVFTIAKTSALLGLVLMGLAIGRNVEAAHWNFGHFWDNIGSSATFPQLGVSGLIGVAIALAAAQVGSLFSADAWNNITFTAGEVKNPRRDLPLSLALGTGIVIALYVAANFAYLNGLTLQLIQTAPDDRVGTLVMQTMFGAAGAKLMAAAILISTFGCCNGLILAGARVYYAMARDGLFFRGVGELHPRYRTPVVSLIVQGVWCCLLALSGSYSQILDYVIFAVLVFYILTIFGLFVLRRTRPDAERPYRAFGYPVVPAIYIALALFIEIVLLRYKPQYTWPGLIIVLLGVPVYFLWRMKSDRKIAG
jgi:APA family basic amino acid/polyamine antiporter